MSLLGARAWRKSIDKLLFQAGQNTHGAVVISRSVTLLYGELSTHKIVCLYWLILETFKFKAGLSLQILDAEDSDSPELT